MSFFGVTVHTIEEIYPHSNADKLELGKVSGLNFQFVMGKDNYKIGDKVLYFPIDSLIPTTLAEKMGLVGFNPDKETHRIKTVKLRGEISQGFVCPPMSDYIDSEIFERGNTEEITEHLGVVKFEPEEKICQDGILRDLPSGLGVYDIDGAERNMSIINSLMDDTVQITEKIEGSNFSVAAYPNGNITVNSRNNTIEEIKSFTLPKTKESMSKNMVGVLYNMGIIERPSRENPEAGLFGKKIAEQFTERLTLDLTPKKNIFWKVARRDRVIELAKSLVEDLGVPVVVYGELIGPGIQGNYYGLKEAEVHLFDVKIADDESATSWHWMDVLEFDSVISSFYGDDTLMVPILWMGTLRGFLDGSDVVTKSSGSSKYCSKLREGIVIKKFGNERVIIKQRDPIYLAKSGN